MANLVEELGSETFHSKFAGSFFTDNEGRPCVLTGVRGDGTVSAKAVSGTFKSPRVADIRLPYAHFTSLSLFKTPKLGWRNAYEGRFMAYLSRNNRSYHRGTSENNLTVGRSAMTDWLITTGNFSLNMSDSRLCLLTLAPEYVTLREGLTAMREGKVLAFAMSPDVAVFPAEDDTYSIYFRQSVAGKVLADNSLEVTIPLLNTYLEETQ